MSSPQQLECFRIKTCLSIGLFTPNIILLELTDIEPATFRMRSGRSATELQPRVHLAIILKFVKIIKFATFLLQTI
jgi:hypothetical protein